MANPLTGRTMANASGWLRQNQGVHLSIDNRESLLNLPSPTVAYRGTFLLRFLAAQHPRPGEVFRIEFRDPALLSITWAEAVEDAYYVAWDFLADTCGFLHPDRNATRITPAGWAFLESLEQNPDSSIGFVAMSFDPALRYVYDQALRPAIEQAGYDAIRLDDSRHEGLIDAQMIATIRRARFVVADFTTQNSGVYYEAGYARGRGIRVFRTCRADDAKNVHFDQNHYHVLRWEPERLPELQDELRFRIEASVGRGPRARPA